MKRNTLISGAVLACGLGGALFASQDTGIVAGLNRFSASLYREAGRNGAGNLVVSPFNVSNALSMALAGARGETSAEISRVLGAGGEYHTSLAALLDQITKEANTGGNQLLNANALGVQQGFPILTEFRGILQNRYHAAPTPVDFRSDPEGSRREINAWTEQKTRGKIRELFGPGAIDRRARLVLSSAVYFYGKWERPFRRNETQAAPFSLSPGATKQAEFMHQTGTFGYKETLAGQILEMSYAGTGIAFDILLPKAGTPLERMQAEISGEGLAAWTGTLEKRTVEASIPKFRIESGLPLTNMLTRLGMGTAFSSGADFSGIDDRRDLQLSQVVHKAFVDVTEEGTEAAAATGATVTMIAARPATGTVFRADHPFHFLIRDTRTGLILFAGRVMDPQDRL